MLLKEFYDHIYPNTGYTHTRVTCRGLVFNEKGELALIHIKGDDIFGHRDHYESPGGGVEDGESHVETLKREVLEELGFECTVKGYLGLVINFTTYSKLLQLITIMLLR